jgi:hypothetical protein
MDGLALHAGFVSFTGDRFGIHDHKARQPPRSLPWTMAVSVTPGHSAVTVTLLPLISSDNASLNDKSVRLRDGCWPSNVLGSRGAFSVRPGGFIASPTAPAFQKVHFSGEKT